MTDDREYHDLSYEETEKIVRTFLHDKNNGGSVIKFDLSPQSEYRNYNLDEPTSKGDLEEEINGP